MQPPVNLFFLDKSPAYAELLEDDTEEISGKGKGNKLVCHLCLALITYQGEKTDIHGNSVYSRINPAGYTYTFACYSSAPGCAVFGSPTGENTWFNGHTWQLALCNACGEHLGWLFTGEYRFFGLICDRLVDNEV